MLLPMHQKVLHVGCCSELPAYREALGEAFNRFLQEELNSSSENRCEGKEHSFFHILHLFWPHITRRLQHSCLLSFSEGEGV